MLPDAVVMFCTDSGAEMLRIAPGGFYIRGRLLPQDADEARAVHAAFMAWIERTGIFQWH